jgi:hypothetical protein
MAGFQPILYGRFWVTREISPTAIDETMKSIAERGADPVLEGRYKKAIASSEQREIVLKAFAETQAATDGEVWTTNALWGILLFKELHRAGWLRWVGVVGGALVLFGSAILLSLASTAQAAQGHAAGGHLIYGMKARSGIASELCGLDVDSDAAISAVEGRIRDGISPRVSGVHSVSIKLSNSRVVVLRIPC